MKPTKKQVIDLIKRYEKTFVESEEIKLAIEIHRAHTRHVRPRRLRILQGHNRAQRTNRKKCDKIVICG